MNKYVFALPDEWNIEDCKITIKNNAITIEDPESTYISSLNGHIYKFEEDPAWLSVHARVAKCVKELRSKLGFGYIVDPCGGIQALEITTLEIINKITRNKNKWLKFDRGLY